MSLSSSTMVCFCLCALASCHFVPNNSPFRLATQPDVHSNYGNWQYVSGVGTDPRDYRKFNMIKQQKDYDPSGEYVQTWVHELRGLSPGHPGLFMPWEMKQTVTGYPAPILIEPEWSKFSSQRRGDSSQSNRRGNGGRGKGKQPMQQEQTPNTFTPRKSDWKIVITKRDPSKPTE